MRFDPDEDGIADLEESREIRAYLRQVAIKVKNTAVGIAPVRTGHYKRALSVVIRRSRGRGIVYVAARDFKAHWIEWGAKGSPYRGGQNFRARHVLQRAVRLNRLRFTKSKKIPSRYINPRSHWWRWHTP